MATKRTLKAEELAASVTFEFEGEVYTVPPAKEWDIDVVEAQEDGKVLAAIRLLLGDEQYGNFRKKHKKMAELEKFVIAMYDAIDEDPKG